MKRLVVVAIMVAFLLGTVGAAQAIQFQAKGDFQVSANYVKNPNFSKDAKDDSFSAWQRYRITFEFIANENLKGVVRAHLEDQRWGAGAQQTGPVGGPFGNFDVGQRRAFNYDRAYLDFMIPNTQVNIKAGLMGIALPATLGSHILDDNIWTLVGSTQFNDMVGLTLGWGRLSDASSTPVNFPDFDDYSKDEIDMFYAVIPVTLDGMQFNPFLAYARSGKYAFDNVFGRSANHWWAGINATVDMFDPIVIMADFNYGGRDHVARAGGESLFKAAGWVADLAVAYKMDFMTPTLWGLYESGESRTSQIPTNKSKVMPTISPDTAGISTFGFSGSNFRNNAGGRLGLNGPTGKWGVGLKLADITFIDKLTHDFQIAYYKGTNDRRNINLFTRKDSAWEVNFDSKYMLYENLAAILELGYIGLNLQSDSVYTGTGDDDNAWKAALGLRYRF